MNKITSRHLAILIVSFLAILLLQSAFTSSGAAAQSGDGDGPPSSGNETTALAAHVVDTLTVHLVLKVSSATYLVTMALAQATAA